MFMTNTVIVCDTKGQNIFVQCIKQREACEHPLIRRIRTSAIIRSAGLYDRAQTKLTARNLKQSTHRKPWNDLRYLERGQAQQCLHKKKRLRTFD